MPALVLVARRVKIWIEPLLFRTISIHHTVPPLPFSRLPFAAVAKLVIFQPDALREHTRHVCFVDVRLADVVPDFLSRCRCIMNLAFVRTVWVPHLDFLLTRLPLERLSFTLRALGMIFPWPDPFDGAHSLFSSITHLSILDYEVQADDWRTWSGLAEIPNLTHLSSINGMSNSVLRGALKHCTRLEALVWVYPSQASLDENEAPTTEITDDPRFVALVVSNRFVDWETGARGGSDYWADASALVEARRYEGKVKDC
ncbi:hypothetical protein K438DRAFT_448822 [Mycena galopus ATCC 62051]|nr:hypothetical protein K438DRAFT_448822 [Mycena galopus ATCC 62051]